ncbi:MAG: thiamine pyrophosphate-binding protein [Rhodospirillaceae bacterium]|nr:thiamine pyrophosphate-binding protein [Rhodospirillaceae bacterium]
MSMHRPNAVTGAEAMVRMLQGYGVRHIFGLCGDTSLPFYDALYRLDHGIDHILTRDERSAAYMADAYARVSGRVGVCEGPSGGGATYIAPGLVEANESSIPILAINSDVSTTSAGRYPLTELDQAALFRPLTKWNAVIPSADMLPRLVRAAFRAMTTGRPGAAHLGLPIDVQKAPAPEGEIWWEAGHARFPAWPAAPDPAAVEAALDRLLAAERPLLVCGGGVVNSGGEAELARLAERLDLAVATTISGRGSLADTHPNMVGVVGSNGGVVATRDVVEAADVVVFIGCRAGSVTTERWRFPAPGTDIIHIDADPMVIGASYRTQVAVVADARLALAAMNAALARRTGTPLPRFGGGDLAQAARLAKHAAFKPLADSLERPIRPERVVAALNACLPDDAVVVADPGTPCPYLSAFLVMDKPGRRFISNRAHGALGYSLSAAVGAHYARPAAKCISVMGDGSFGFTAGELETIVRKQLPIAFIVVANATYGWIKAGQRSGFGGRYFSVDFSATDHAAVARAFGVPAERVEDPEQVLPAIRRAVEAGGPALVDIACQPLHEAHAPVSEWIA